MRMQRNFLSALAYLGIITIALTPACTENGASPPPPAEMPPADQAPQSGTIPQPDTTEPMVPPGPGDIQVTQTIKPGCTCEFGGQKILTGPDDGTGGAVAGDGQLSGGEIHNSQTVCLSAPPSDQITDYGLNAMLAHGCAPPTGTSFTEGVTTTNAFKNLVFPANSKCQLNVNDNNCSNAHRPSAMVQHPTSGDWYLTEQTGRVLKFANSDATTQVDVVLDIEKKVISGYEPGLLNITFDERNPDYAYLSYLTCQSQLPNAVKDDSVVCTDGEGANAYMAVSRFHLSSGVFDRNSERIVVETTKGLTEHNGGGGKMGPDGMLYVAWGDGGAFPSDTAQNGNSLLGKILRLKVNDENGVPLEGEPRYLIPSDNPFVNDASVRDEVYAIGFRNPWRFDFAPWSLGQPVRIYVGDVGLVTMEEVDYVEPGKNYGWPIMEGTYCRPTGDAANHVTVLPTFDCNLSGTYTLPVVAYKQGYGVAVTGGFVYRGSAIPSLSGKFIFADYSLGKIWSLEKSQSSFKKQWLLDVQNLIPSFAQSSDGELYFFDWWSGSISKLIPTSVKAARPPEHLSDTGCVSESDIKTPATGGIPYSLNVPFFSEDGVCKTRMLYLPTGAGLTEYDHTGSLIFQPGTVIVKNFDVGDKRIETRVMYMNQDYAWTSWSYKWRDDQTEADLMDDHLDATYGDIHWSYPDRGECFQCHTHPAGRVLGVRVQQINKLNYFSETGKWANMIDTLRHLNAINRVVPIDPNQPISGSNSTIVAMPASSTLPKFPRIDDETASLGSRVKGYLESNCSHCHRPAGGGRGNFSLLSSDVFVAGKGICNTSLQSNVFDDDRMRVVVPGSLTRSMLYRRLQESNSPYSMHPYRFSVDAKGVALIGRWINEAAAQDCAP